MSFTPDVLTRLERMLERYNGRDYDPTTNPLGLARGGNQRNPTNIDGNFVALGRDVAIVVAAMAQEMLATRAALQDLADLVAIQAVIVEGGPVTSIRVGDGPPLTGNVRIVLDAISAALNEQVAQVRAAQAALETRAASAQAYSLAFGD